MHASRSFVVRHSGCCGVLLSLEPPHTHDMKHNQEQEALSLHVCMNAKFLSLFSELHFLLLM